MHDCGNTFKQDLCLSSPTNTRHTHPSRSEEPLILHRKTARDDAVPKVVLTHCTARRSRTSNGDKLSKISMNQERFRTERIASCQPRRGIEEATRVDIGRAAGV